MSHLSPVIDRTGAPSWPGSVPHNFEEIPLGTIKAAEWRVLCTVHLPTALVSFYGDGASHDTPEDASARRQILDHTMSLVSAVTLVCSWPMSSRRAQDYLKYLKRHCTRSDVIQPDWTSFNLHGAIGRHAVILSTQSSCFSIHIQAHNAKSDSLGLISLVDVMSPQTLPRVYLSLFCLSVDFYYEISW